MKAYVDQANTGLKSYGDATYYAKTGGTISGSVSVTNDLTVSGNLIVSGSSVTLDTTSIAANDTLIYLGIGNYVSDVQDIGFIGHYNNGANAHTGLFRDPNLKEYIFFQGYTPEVQSNNLINIADPSFVYANVYASYHKGNLIANTAVVNGVDVFTYTTSAFNQANAANVLAQAAFNQANTASSNTVVTQGVDATQNTWISSNATFSQSAYNLANTTSTLTQSAYNQANTASSNTIVIQGVDTTQNTWISSNATFSQSAYNQANSANVLAQSAFNQANAANILAQAAFSQANLAYTAANSAASSVNASNISTGTISTSRFPTSGVTSGTYGGSTQIPVLTVDTYGRITLASNTSVSTTINLTGTSGSGSVSGGGTLTFSSSNGVTASISGSTVTLSTPQDLRTTASPTFNVVTQTTATVTSSSSSTVSQSVLNASSATTAQTNIDSFTTTTYRSAKYMVQATQGSNYHIIELLLTANTTTAWLAQYGEVYTNTPLATFDAYISSNTVYLVANPASVSSTNYIVYRTGISLT